MTDRARTLETLRLIAAMQRYLRAHAYNHEARALSADLASFRVGLLYDEMQRREARDWARKDAAE